MFSLSFKIKWSGLWVSKEKSSKRRFFRSEVRRTRSKAKGDLRPADLRLCERTGEPDAFSGTQWRGDSVIRRSAYKKQKTARKFELSFKIKWSGLREREKTTECCFLEAKSPKQGVFEGEKPQARKQLCDLTGLEPKHLRCFWRVYAPFRLRNKLVFALK